MEPVRMLPGSKLHRSQPLFYFVPQSSWLEQTYANTITYATHASIRNQAAWRCDLNNTQQSIYYFHKLRGKIMASISYASLLLVNICCQCHAWRWSAASQTAQTFSDLLRIKNGSPQKTFIQDNRGSQQQQNYATEEHFWTSLGTKSGSYSSSGLEVTSPYSAYGLIHKVATDPRIWSSQMV